MRRLPTTDEELAELSGLVVEVLKNEHLHITRRT